MIHQQSSSTCLDQNINQDTISINLKQITSEFLNEVVQNANHDKLLQCHNRLVNALMQIWEGVEHGVFRIDCMAMLRSICKVTCPEILSYINDPDYNRSKLLRELRLLLNTIEFVF